MRGPYTYDARAYSYRDGAGRFVSDRQVREALDGALDAHTKTVRALGESLRAGRISVAEWQTGMARAIKNAHLYSAAAARGGWQNMTPADYGRAGQKIRAQYGYLRDFAAQIVDGRQPLDGRFLQCVDLYGQSGRVTYHATERREMEVRGMTEERNVLHPSDHCPGCVDESARGWVPIGSLVPIGSRDCRTRDRCTVAYR